MKLTELILQLHTIMLDKGNLDVYAQYGCGCCIWPEEPQVKIVEDDKYGDPNGVYLN